MYLETFPIFLAKILASIALSLADRIWKEVVLSPTSTNSSPFEIIAIFGIFATDN